ncbi:acetyl-CoA carboxylase biotin carboxyl carrier protein subunit [Ureibacillus sp. FSL K6-8385]|uniref:Acetyl-CoA carboxylase biotin carboxyl carrier protein subunit n=1 Tax=Ureibacillus terrenus TaxID=118246 RepID=A0A540V1C5_9BACL|nr:acetyl-CoA carboxylase biotin carboxyl carrier protein subunit [Ureibacillus terrenus]MED3662332.1 acetyl-CoA carboxylase biotin carboxyl carrier protein subunit [Ureibacillus terrenus]MED3764530.1 acetyl-CoA carboxylase biotin carboxyl carrier protein subunit [Ureibacillus terrenus]TQE90554.1 acetyl-CoA carboxylase biotin carboxyl carrier protein subunit [Ureibacillus terrenus]
MSTIVKANMAGTVWKIVVSEGEQVEAGQDVVILESMKMEIPIVAETSGTVKKIFVQEGDFINLDDDIIEIE